MLTTQAVPQLESHAVKLDPVVLLSCAAAGFMAVASWGGVFDPSIYAQETPSWRAQGQGQDWVNMLLLVPLMLGACASAGFGSRRGMLLQGGFLAYTVYSYFIYAFGVHFNGLFLTYCAALGCSFFALVWLFMRAYANGAKGWFTSDAPVKAVGIFQVAMAALFALLWLAEDVPALRNGIAPPSLADVGTVTNPVHILDLSIVLPAMALAGVLLMKRHPLGFVLSPVMLTFGAAMALAIAGMVFFMVRVGLATDVTPVVAMAVAAVGSVGMLAWLMQHMRTQHQER